MKLFSSGIIKSWNIKEFISYFLLPIVFTILHVVGPPSSRACPLVVKAGDDKKVVTYVGGYCRINGLYNPSAPVSGPQTRRRAFITNSDGDSVSIINRDTYKVIKTIHVGDYPHHMIVSLDGHQLYVGNTHSDTVSVIDLVTEKNVKTLPLLDPYNYYYTPDRKLLVTTCTRLGRVEIHEPESWSSIEAADGWRRLARIPTGKDPNHFAFSSDSQFMYVSNEYSHLLSVIDLKKRKLVRQVKTGRRPVDVSLAPGGKFLFLANYTDGTVAVYDTNSFNRIAEISTGAGAHGMAMTTNGKTLFVSNRDAGTISAIDVKSFKINRTFKVPQGPDMLEVTPDGKELWVTGRYGANIYVVNLKKGIFTHRIKTGASPHGIMLLDLVIPPRM